ncbi:hypothetical protein, partial [Escherichia coli]|uniref:hypothetical protein n=1 Tax=Escherichia coli TaxID=562 RepID=UPI003D660257
DYVQWINKVLENNGKSQEIVLYGVSMGAATVMMTSGEKLPDNVKAIIEDCGYSSVHDELAYQLDDMSSSISAYASNESSDKSPCWLLFR